MKGSVRKQKVSQRIFNDPAQTEREMNYRGLPQNQRLGFAKQPCYLLNCPKRKNKNGCDGHVRVTTPERAEELGIPIWRRVNPVLKPKARCTMYEVTAILNIVYEFEFRSNPEIAIMTARRFKENLVRKGLAPSDLPIINSGGGAHLITNIPVINITKETAKRWNRAIERFVDEQVCPLFEDAKKYVQAFFPREDLSQMNLEGTDIARLLSSSGDWRPSTHDEDHISLKDGYIRTVCENQTLIRHEWPPLKLWIEKYYHEIEEDRVESIITEFTSKRIEIEFDASVFSLFEEIALSNMLHSTREAFEYAFKREIVAKNKKNLEEGKVKFLPGTHTIDRSKLVNQIVWSVCGMCQVNNIDHRKVVYAFRSIINECCGNKYESDARLKGALDAFMKDWEVKNADQNVHINHKYRRIKQRIEMSQEEALDAFLLDLDSVHKISKDEFIAKYAEWCTKHKTVQMGKNQLTTALGAKGIRTITVGKKRIRYYVFDAAAGNNNINNMIV
jgi:hypothetical protein